MQRVNASSNPNDRRTDRGASSKYFTFQLAREEYGFPILNVSQIIGAQEVTPLPRTPPHVKGVMNLRGRIVPVIDLRARLGLAPVPPTNETCIVILETSDSALVGAIVDRVCDVHEFEPSSIAVPPVATNDGGAALVRGVARVKERVVLLLNVDAVLDLAGVEAAMRSAA